MSSPSSDREREASLAVASERPARVADEIAGLRELAGFRLEPRPERRLRDVYLDRPGGDLRTAGLALRLRRGGGAPPRLAVKGDRRPVAGGVDRLEVELPWGPEALAAVREVLASEGLPPAWLPGTAGPDEPLERLRSTGWEPVQDRRTRRRPRRLESAAGETAGELAVDEVRFRPAGHTAVHREVEIEAPPGGTLPTAVGEALLDRFPVDLRSWTHAKLATGRALERLLGEGDPARWLGADDVLLPAAYDRLQELLAEG